MPLTPLQFQMRISPETERWMRAAHKFLERNSTLAYSEVEILGALGGSEDDKAALAIAMFELIYRGGVDAREYEGLTYYRYFDPIPEFA